MAKAEDRAAHRFKAPIKTEGRIIKDSSGHRRRGLQDEDLPLEAILQIPQASEARLPETAQPMEMGMIDRPPEVTA